MRVYLFLALRALCAVIYPFSGLLYLTLEFCASERRLSNKRRHLHVSRRYTHPLRPVYTCFVSALCPLYAQEVCHRLNLPVILNLIWPGHPPFICACKRRLPINIPLYLHYAVHVLYSRPTRLSRFKGVYSMTRMKNIFKMNKKVGMLLPKRADTRGVGISNMRKSTFLQPQQLATPIDSTHTHLLLTTPIDSTHSH